MCTVTSHLFGGRLLLTMNRDEYRSRAPERPPVVVDGDPQWVGPLDGQSGGTWIGASAAGVVACLLNIYTADEDGPPTSADLTSRGDIIPALLAKGPMAQVDEWLLAGLTPADYAPFRLLVADSASRAVYTWSGSGCLGKTDVAEGWHLLSSSSWHGDEVLAWRREKFDQWVADGALIAGELPTYHLLQPDGLADRSPLMARELAATLSITQIALDGPGAKTIIRYWPEPTADTLGRPAQTSLRLPHTV